MIRECLRAILWLVIKKSIQEESLSSFSNASFNLLLLRSSSLLRGFHLAEDKRNVHDNDDKDAADLQPVELLAEDDPVPKE